MESPKAFGPFEVRGELSRGAGGVVYVAWNPEHDRTAAVKHYNTVPRHATGAMSRLKRDAQAAGALGHPNIAAVLGVGDYDGLPWVATEFVPGVSLAQVLRGRALLPIERVLDVWRQMCEGLAHAHREGVLHLDLKPADVRLAPTGEVKLVDFGAWHLKALEHGGPGPTDAGLHYRAPELLTGRRPDNRADIFSVAAIVYELVAYRKAFPGDSTTDVVRGLTRCDPDLACLPRSPFSPGFERVLALSLARAPESRHPAFEDVHADLVQLVRDTAPRLRSQAAESSEAGPPEREELLASVTRARAEDRLEDALEGCRKLLERDSEDESARRAMSEVESVLLEREVDTLVGMALAYAADGQLTLATEIAEKVERLAPWSPRYLQLQVYLDEESARHRADALVVTAREHLAAGRLAEARASAHEAIAIMPAHTQAARLAEELGRVAPPAPEAPEPLADAVAAASEAPTATPAAGAGTAVPAPKPMADAAPEPIAAAPAAKPKTTAKAVPSTGAATAVTAAPVAAAAKAAAPTAKAAAPAAKAAAPAHQATAPAAAAKEVRAPAEAVAAAAPDASVAAPAAPAVPPGVPVAPLATEAVAGSASPVPPASAPPDPRVAEAVSLSATALHHFLKDEHARAREAVERALALDPGNRRALELQKILRVLG